MNNYKKTEDMAVDFHAITEYMCDTFTIKNHDYGNSFFESLDNKGLVAAVVRMEDKMNRLDTLCMADSKVKDESKRDTLLDLANYAIMTVMWLDGKDKKGGVQEEDVQKAKEFCNTTIKDIKIDIDNGHGTVDAFEVRNTLEYLQKLLDK